MSTAFFMVCLSPLKGYEDAFTGGITFKKTVESFVPMDVACGQCLGCRLDYGLMWSVRIGHEASLYRSLGGSCMVTLTYRDRRECSLEQLRKQKHVPDDWSLHLSHFQNFMKRLRKTTRRKLRYFHVGEYGRKCRHGYDVEMEKCVHGCRLGRPHYHACLFNEDFSDDLVPYGSDFGEMRFTSPRLAETWGFGFVDVSDLNFTTAAYVARYILKKVNGVRAWDHYYATDLDGKAIQLQREYATMSRGGICEECGERSCKNAPGGIGKKWFELYKGDVFPADEVPVLGKGVLKKVPRFYEELFKIERPLKLEEIKEIRKKYKKENPREFEPDRLEAKFKCMKARLELRTRRRL